VVGLDYDTSVKADQGWKNKRSEGLIMPSARVGLSMPLQANTAPGHF